MLAEPTQLHRRPNFQKASRLTPDFTPAPDDIGGIDANHLAAREAVLDNPAGFVVPVIAEAGDDDVFVGDIEVRVGCRQALILVNNCHWRGQPDDVKLLTAGEPINELNQGKLYHMVVSQTLVLYESYF